MFGKCGCDCACNIVRDGFGLGFGLGLVLGIGLGVGLSADFGLSAAGSFVTTVGIGTEVVVRAVDLPEVFAVESETPVFPVLEKLVFVVGV
jgi:hypothetical protein